MTSIWSSITSYISYAEIADYLDIDTSTDLVKDGSLTVEGIDYVYEKVCKFCEQYKQKNKTDPTEELRIAEENKLIQQLVDNYIDPIDVVKRIDWGKKFDFINNYTLNGSQLDFLKDAITPGLSLITFETEDGFALTVYPPIMIIINDFHYAETSSLPEFNFEEIIASDVIDVVSQAISTNLCEIESEVAEYVY